MKKEKEKKGYVKVNDSYRITVEARNYTLEKYTEKGLKIVGYYTQIEPMVYRIAYLNALDKINEKEITFKEYYAMLINERKEIRKLLEALQLA